MSFELFEKLEAKVQQVLDKIAHLQRELEELKEQNRSLSAQAQEAVAGRDALVSENERLQQEQSQWQERLQTLLNRMEEV